MTEAFADEMSYCLGCLACQTACPAGVNYAELFETARSDIERSGINDAPARNLWRALTLGFLFRNPRALRVVGLLTRIYQRSGIEARPPHLRPDDVPAGDPASSGAADAADGGGVLESIDRARGVSARRGALPRGAPDRLHSGPRVPGRQPRHRRCAHRQRLCRRRPRHRSRAADRCTRTTASSSWLASRRAG